MRSSDHPSLDATLALYPKNKEGMPPFSLALSLLLYPLHECYYTIYLPLPASSQLVPRVLLRLSKTYLSDNPS